VVWEGEALSRDRLRPSQETAARTEPRPPDLPSSEDLSSEQLRRELVQVVSPVDPGVAAAAEMELVLDPLLLQQRRQILRSGQEEVLVTDADREQLHQPVDPV